MKRLFSLILMAALYLGSYKGCLALWQTGSDAPEQIFPCRVTSLPQADQELLEKGIPIRNDQELQQRLEDYLS